MTWMETITGGSMDYLSPDPKEVRLRDIAHSLAHQSRYTGHVEHSYSPAEHCLWAWKLVSLHFPEDYMLQLHTVLHDAGEAYVCDISFPLKQAMRKLSDGKLSVYDKIEHVVQRTVLIRFGMPSPDERTQKIVKSADLTMRSTERHCPALRPKTRGRWSTDELPPHQDLLDGTVILEPRAMVPDADWSGSLPEIVRFPSVVALMQSADGTPGYRYQTRPLFARDVAELYIGLTERLLKLTERQRLPEVS